MKNPHVKATWGSEQMMRAVIPSQHLKSSPQTLKERHSQNLQMDNKLEGNERKHKSFY